MKRTPLRWKEYYKKNQERKEYNYDGPLGAEVTEEGTVIRLWSPVADEVRLNLYYDGGKGGIVKDGYGVFVAEDPEDSSNIAMTVPMTYDSTNGVYSYSTPENLSGAYYDFDVTVEGVTRRTADPYAKAAGVNGLRSMIISDEMTFVDGWDSDTAPKKQGTDIIYEINIREFSYCLEMGEDSGKYSAFKRFLSGEKFKIKGTDHFINPFEYMKKLGVTHVQLMPSYDFGSVDERFETEDFNWGYDPVNYNVPEGSFSKNPSDGALRVREYKEMIKALHEAGFRVIMDVVYNHTYNRDSFLDRTVPYYYYRIDKDGKESNGSKCGNDIASERKMVSRYILDSVMYWANEYHLDGFRFDLMGLLDTELMNKIRKSLDEKFGIDEKLIYGEPWAPAKTTMDCGFKQALKENASKYLDKNIGFFSDDLRDAIKGSVFDDESRGFVNGGKYAEEIADAALGFENKGFCPSQIIRYVSSHDDLTLWDKLSITSKDHEERIKEVKLAAAIYILGRGHVFMLSGEEFLRSKDGEDNSYNLHISLNKLDWEKAFTNEKIVDYYSELIKIRKDSEVLSDITGQSAEKIKMHKSEDGIVIFSAGEYLIIFNGSKEKYKDTIDNVQIEADEVSAAVYKCGKKIPLD